MFEPINLLTIAFVVLLVVISEKTLFQKVTIFQYEKGMKYKKGKFDGLLESGQYTFFKPSNITVKKVDIRPFFATIAGQEVITADNIGLKISVVVKYEIVDFDIAINKVQNYYQDSYLEIQLATREIMSSEKVDDILKNLSIFNEKIMKIASPNIEKLGLKLISANIKDIMFPGELKKVFAQVVKAQKEGLAKLEKARGESAALRNLANASKMLENNPTLMQLRLIQAIEQSTGNAIFIGNQEQQLSKKSIITQDDLTNS